MIILQVPLLPGESDIGQLVKIADIFGTPTETNWPVSSSIDFLDNFLIHSNFLSEIRIVDPCQIILKSSQQNQNHFELFFQCQNKMNLMS